MLNPFNTKNEEKSKCPNNKIYSQVPISIDIILRGKNITKNDKENIFFSFNSTDHTDEKLSDTTR